MRNQPLQFLPGSKNLILACHFTGIYDVNRNNVLPDDNYNLVKDWAESVARLGLKGVVFHNNFTEETCQKYQNEFVSFTRVTHNTAHNPNVYRYFLYNDFIKKHAQNIENLFVTDVSDVVVVKNPFTEPLFVQNADALFCGDEPKTLDNPWMIDHATHLRNNIADYAQYEAQYKQETLLNCGIIGGNIGVMQPFMAQLWELHQLYNHNNKTAYTGDMGAFNYLVRTQFNSNLRHGEPVNTVFKAYQNDRTDCWFRHK